MSSRYNGLLADCDGCGHLVKGGASATCDYVLHTGQPRGCPPGKDCLHYIDKQIWEEKNMKKNNGHRIRPAAPPPPVMPPKPQAAPPPAAPLVQAKSSGAVSDSDTSSASANMDAAAITDGRIEQKDNIKGEQVQMETTAATKIMDDFGNKSDGLTVDRLALLLHRCQMAGLGGNQVSINGKPLPDTDTIAALIREDGIVVELTGAVDRS